MEKKFRFTIELKAQVLDKPQGMGKIEDLERVQRLAQCVGANENVLLEIFKAQFTDLLSGDYYSDAFSEISDPKGDAELLLPAVQEMSPQDSAFFTRLLVQRSDESGIDKDNILNLFYSQFENPAIQSVSFELVE